MKIQIYNWAGDRQAKALLEGLGFEHSCLYEVENVFEFAEKLHSTGLNVMLPQPSTDGIQLVAVDFKRLFSQR